MPYDEKTAGRVREILGERHAPIEVKMMGGLCFMVGGSMCCGVMRSGLMVRVGAAAYAEMLTRPHVGPLEFGGRRPTGFVVIEPAGYETKTALERWVRRGIDFGSALPPRAPKQRSR